jgi:hypothetical protein
MNDETRFAAFALAVGDVLSLQLLEARAIVESLRVKGLLSVSEYTEAKDRLFSKSAEQVGDSIATQLQQRMAAHLAQLLGPEQVQ